MPQSFRWKGFLGCKASGMRREHDVRGSSRWGATHFHPVYGVFLFHCLWVFFPLPSPLGFSLPSPLGFLLPSSLDFRLPSPLGFPLPSTLGFRLPPPMFFPHPSQPRHIHPSHPRVVGRHGLKWEAAKLAGSHGRGMLRQLSLPAALR